MKEGKGEGEWKPGGESREGFEGGQAGGRGPEEGSEMKEGGLLEGGKRSMHEEVIPIKIEEK
jgi:hypothetical protein